MRPRDLFPRRVRRRVVVNCRVPILGDDGLIVAGPEWALREAWGEGWSWFGRTFGWREIGSPEAERVGAALRWEGQRGFRWDEATTAEMKAEIDRRRTAPPNPTRGVDERAREWRWWNRP